MDCSLPGSFVHGIPRKKYWSVLPFSSPGDLPDSGIKPMIKTALAGGFFTTCPPGKPISPTTLKWRSEMKVAQLCPNLCDHMEHTVHRILQARILEWVAIPFSRGSSRHRDQTWVSCIAGGFFTIWDTREALKLWVGLNKVTCNPHLPPVNTATSPNKQLNLEEVISFLKIEEKWKVCTCTS